ncbi:MAG: hypothetical protein Q8R01_07160 [Ramlibacter sp.]|jgi:hypothetical protein|nr:hypothetical protein [Ramlibacter sp.]
MTISSPEINQKDGQRAPRADHLGSTVKVAFATKFGLPAGISVA